MATATSTTKDDTTKDDTTKDNTAAEMPEIAQKIREQLLSTAQQGQQLSVDAAQAWVKAISVLPIPDLPTIPGIPTVASMEASTTFALDVAADLLKSQRDFAQQLANVFTSAKSA
jgi:tyrosyl-tRNA synthetase